MNPEVKTRWLEALESGKYTKGKTYLSCDGQFCCLGVLADIEGLFNGEVDNTKCIDGNHCLIPFKIAETYGLDIKGVTNSHQCELAEINDTSDTFAEVIEYIKEKL